MCMCRTNVKARANSADKGAGLNKRKIIEKAVTDELCAMVDSGGDGKLADLKKGQPNVIMFVGLQGETQRAAAFAPCCHRLFWTSLCVAAAIAVETIYW